MAEADVDPDMAQLYDLLGASPPLRVPLPRPAPGREEITEATAMAQSPFRGMNTLSGKVDPAAWEKFLAENPESDNIEDRRQETPKMMKDRVRQRFDFIIKEMSPENRVAFEQELHENFGPDDQVPAELHPRGPK